MCTGIRKVSQDLVFCFDLEFVSPFASVSLTAEGHDRLQDLHPWPRYRHALAHVGSFTGSAHALRALI